MIGELRWLARLRRDVTELRAGLSLIMGEVGCGDTVLAATLADPLAGTPHASIALVMPRPTPVEQPRAVAELLGMGSRPHEGRTDKHLRVALFGQPELRDRVADVAEDRE